MMQKSNIENCIIKFLNKEATSEELDQLSEWITIPGNQEIFDQYVQSHYEITTAINEPNVEKIKKELVEGIKRDKESRKIHPFQKLMKYAAVGILFLGLGFAFQQWYTNTNALEDQLLIPTAQSVTIETENGEVQTLKMEGSKVIRNKDGQIVGSQKGTKLIYSKSEKETALVYNTIHVPYGKRFNLILSDGTHVVLNAGTSLKYPIQFLKGNDRNVYIEGEAYFDVAKDAAHPFKVHADEIEVRVLGTKFNVSHYPKNAEIQTVLVEGAVSLQSDSSIGSEPTILKPGNMAGWNKNAKKISVQNVDTNLYTAWIQGKLVFRNSTFQNIRESLERKYNVVIKNKNKDLDQQRFDATFDIETIEEVLETFSKSYAIDYEIKNNQVIIN